MYFNVYFILGFIRCTCCIGVLINDYNDADNNCITITGLTTNTKYQLEKSLRGSKPPPGHHLEFQSRDQSNRASISNIFSRYLHRSKYGTRPWLFIVAWRYRLHDRLIPQVPFNGIYRCYVVTESVSPAVFEITGPKHIGSRPWPFMVTWRYRSHDHSNRYMPFPTGGPLEPTTSLYLQPFSRYSVQKC